MAATISHEDLTNALGDVNSKLAHLVEASKQRTAKQKAARPRAAGQKIESLSDEAKLDPAVLAAMRTSHLVANLLEQLDLSGDAVAWTTEMNHRRCELIDKRIAGTITDPESVELHRLQAAASAYRDQTAPLPVDGAKRLHAELLARKAERERLVDQ